MLVDVKGLNIPRHRDVKLNELPKQIFMLLPLLLHWLYFFILGGAAWGSSKIWLLLWLWLLIFVW